MNGNTGLAKKTTLFSLQ